MFQCCIIVIVLIVVGEAQSKRCLQMYSKILLLDDPSVSSKTKRLDTSEQPYYVT